MDRTARNRRTQTSLPGGVGDERSTLPATRLDDQNSNEQARGHGGQRADGKQTTEQAPKPIFIWKHVEHL